MNDEIVNHRVNQCTGIQEGQPLPIVEQYVHAVLRAFHF